MTRAQFNKKIKGMHVINVKEIGTFTVYVVFRMGGIRKIFATEKAAVNYINRHKEEVYQAYEGEEDAGGWIHEKRSLI